jgi:MFS family permease/quinol monooxygenase YgiN
MHDVGSAWLMTTLSPSAFLVALMQAASSLPFFLLALPAGAIADVVDRRKVLLFTQAWMLVIAAVLGLLTIAGITNPWILLLLTFALSIGSSMNMPVWQAIIPELVAKEELSAAATLSGIVINLARAIGPALAGLVIAAAGNTGVVFLLNAASFLGVILVLYRWQRQPQYSALPAERFVGAIQAGIRYARYAPALQTVFIRTGAYIFFSSALFALLPLLGRRELKLDALGYGIILGFWGVGGLAGAFILPKARERASIDQIVAGASLLYGGVMLALAQLRNFYGVCAVMVLVGIASLSVMVSLNVTAQTAVPTWVRARALAMQLLVFQGGMTLGSLLWGAIAQRYGIATALSAAAIGLVVSVVLTSRYRLRCSEKLDLSSSLHWSQPTRVFEPCPNDGPVMITLEYRIDPINAQEFTQAMEKLSQIRRRDGAIQWGLYQDLSDPGRFVETAIVESWAEHKRQFERVTKADRVIEEKARAFHIGEEPPKVSQMIYADYMDGKAPGVPC